MSAFLKPRGSLVSKYLKFELVESAKLVPEPLSTSYCVDLKADPSFCLKDKEGEPLKDGLIKGGQRVTLNLGTVTTNKYHLMMVVNPELLRSAYVGGPSVVEPFSSERIEFMVKAERQLDVSSLDYMIRLYLID